MILLLVGYSCFSSLYYVAFEPPNSLYLKIWDQIVEICFYFELIFNFFQEYIDEDT